MTDTIEPGDQTPPATEGGGMLTPPVEIPAAPEPDPPPPPIIHEPANPQSFAMTTGGTVTGLAVFDADDEDAIAAFETAAGVRLVLAGPGAVPGAAYNDETGTFGPPLAPVPPSISVAQFAREAYAQGLITKAQATAFLKTGTLPPPLANLLALIPEDQRADAELLLIGMTTVERAHPMTSILAASLEKDEAWLDDFFRNAGARL